MTTKNLVVVSYGAIGDALMLLSLLDAAHASDPNLKPYFLAARQGSLPKALGKEYGFVHFLNLKDPRSLVSLLRLAFSKNIVLVPPSFGIVPLHMKVLGVLLSSMRGSIDVGFRDKSNVILYRKILSYDPTKLYYTNLSEALTAVGISVPSLPPIYRSLENPELLSRLSLTKKQYVVLHPFAATKKRELPPKRFAHLVEHLSKTHTVIVTGGKEDQDAAKSIAGTYGRSVAGTLSLSETAALIKDAALFIGVDTGITHLASLMHVPSVVIGNRSNPSWLPTYNPKAQVLFNSERCGCTGDKGGSCSVTEDGREYYRCAYDITDSAIESAIQEALSGQ